MIIAGPMTGTEPGLQLYLFYMNIVILNRIYDTIKKAAFPALLIVSVSGLYACSAGGRIAQQNAEMVFGRDIPGYFASEVIISTGTACGGGTVLDSPADDGTVYVVSAAHLIRTFGSSSEVRDAKGNSLYCEPVWLDEAADIGLLKTDGTSGQAGSARPVSLSDIPAGITCLNADHNALVTGFIAGKNVKTDSFDDLLYLLVSTEEGMSGNGLYDMNGSYCGMVTGSFDDAGAAGVSADTVLAVISDYEESEGGDRK